LKPVKKIRPRKSLAEPVAHFDSATRRLLGLKYGDVLPARRLYELVFERIPSTKLVCSWIDGEVRGTEWSICSGAEGSERYLKAREANLGIN